MTAPAMPGTKVPIPVVPDLGPCLGYQGNARYVVVCYEPDKDSVLVTDGRTTGTGNTWAYQAYRRHRAVAGLLRPFDLTSPESESCLVLDLTGARASVASGIEAAEFLRQVRPAEAPMTAEQLAEMERQVDEAVAQGWREVQVDHAEVMRQMAEQRARMSRVMNWLDMCPDARQEGRGA